MREIFEEFPALVAELEVIASSEKTVKPFFERTSSALSVVGASKVPRLCFPSALRAILE